MPVQILRAQRQLLAIEPLDLSSPSSVTILDSADRSWPEGLSFDTAWIFSANILVHLDFSENIPTGVVLISVGDAIDDVANRLSDEFINIDQKLIQGRFYHSWLASNLGERNPYTSDFLLNICQAIAVIESAHQGGQHCVVVDDYFFGDLLLRACRDNKIGVSWYRPFTSPPRVRL